MRAPHLSIPKLADCRHAGIPPGASRLGLAASRRNLYSSIQWTFDLILTQGSDTLHQLTTSSDAATERPGVASVTVCHSVRALRGLDRGHLACPARLFCITAAAIRGCAKTVQSGL